MTIRTMTPDDYDQVHALWMRTPGMGLNATDDSREGLERYLSRNPRTCFVAVDEEKGGAVIGVIVSGHDGRRGYIYHTTVDPAYRGRGIGSALVERAMEALEREGIHKVAMLVFKDNRLGNDFWERRGFTVRQDVAYRNRNIHELEVIVPR